MEEIREQVVPIMVNGKCDKCDNGIFVKDGNISLMTDPPKFNYKCDLCGNQIISSEVWPRIDYRKIIT